MKKLVYNIGVYDDARISTKEGGMEQSYKSWVTMLRNCYSKKHHAYRAMQKGSTICDEWKFYSEFKKWYNRNYIEGYELDRTIFMQDNKHYCPKLCVYIPRALKKILKKGGKKSSKYPTGVNKTLNNTFSARITIDCKGISLGTYKTSELASKAYVKAKKESIQKKAKHLFSVGQINKEVFNALIEYHI